MSLDSCHLGFRLGLAYAGSNREDVLSLLLPVMGDSKSSMEVWMSVSPWNNDKPSHSAFSGIKCECVSFHSLRWLE